MNLRMLESYLEHDGQSLIYLGLDEDTTRLYLAYIDTYEYKPGIEKTVITPVNYQEIQELKDHKKDIRDWFLGRKLISMTEVYKTYAMNPEVTIKEVTYQELLCRNFFPKPGMFLFS